MKAGSLSVVLIVIALAFTSVYFSSLHRAYSTASDLLFLPSAAASQAQATAPTTSTTASIVNNNHHHHHHHTTSTDEEDDSMMDRDRLLHAVFGDTGTAMADSLRNLALQRPSLRPDLARLEAEFLTTARRVLQSLHDKTELDYEAVERRLATPPSPPSVVLHRATYGPPSSQEGQRQVADRADVKWILEKFIFNSVLRLPKDMNVVPLFGTTPKGQSRGEPYSLEVEATITTTTTAVGDTRKKNVSVSILAPNGRLEQELLLSNAQPTQNIPLSQDKLASVLAAAAKHKRGFEIGGPTYKLFDEHVYRTANTTDLINFSERTLWGTFTDGSTFSYQNGAGTGTVRIMDGSTLQHLPDESYDFAIGSHYLEHLINPLRALHSMRRVVKKNGGHIILVLPRKEACFDHKRGQSTLEQLLTRYIHKVTEQDYNFANVDAWTYGNDLSRDRPAGSLEEFRARSIRFATNRAIHTHVYDLKLLEAMADVLSLTVVARGLSTPLHQWIILKKE